MEKSWVIKSCQMSPKMLVKSILSHFIISLLIFVSIFLTNIIYHVAKAVTFGGHIMTETFSVVFFLLNCILESVFILIDAKKALGAF